MSESTLHYNEIIVRVVAPGHSQTPAPAEQKSSETVVSSDGSENKQEQFYYLYIYTNLKLPGLNGVTETAKVLGDELSGLPLAGVESITVYWDYYQDYLKAFLKGEGAASEMLKREKLFGTLPPGLCALLKGEADGLRPLRIWWGSTSNSLMHIPWEVLVYSEDVGSDLSFVRGLPPELPLAKIPVTGSLRLAFIYDESNTPEALKSALKDLSGIHVEEMTGSPLESLKQAMRDNFELIHLVADGSVSLAYEGVLYLRRPALADVSSKINNPLIRLLLKQIVRLYTYIRAKLPTRIRALKPIVALGVLLDALLFTKTPAETLTPSHLSSLQRGSRLTVLGLSAPKDVLAGKNSVDAVVLPSVYRAFAYMGSSRLPLPSIVAQIGALNDKQLSAFWRSFYQSLAGTKAVERAMAAAALSSGTPAAVALYLRQKEAQTFEDALSSNSAEAHISAELQQSKRTFERLRALSRLDDNLARIVDEFEKREQSHLKRLREL